MAHASLGMVLRHIRSLAAKDGAGRLADWELLQRFACRREEAAFEELLQRHGSMVLGVCRRVLRHSHDAEDAFQATFLALARKAGSIRKRASVGCWLYGVAYRTALKARAAAARRSTLETVIAAMPPPDPLFEMTGRELCAALDEELNRLAERHRAPLLLCYLEGKTRDEAARQLGWSLGTLKRRLEQGRVLLRGRLTRRGLTLSAGLLATLCSESAASAPVPIALAAATVRAGLWFAAGKGAAAGLSTETAAHAEGVLKAMYLAKLKITIVVLLAISLATVNAGVLACQMFATKPIDAKQVDEPKPAARAAVQSPQEEQEQTRNDRYGDPLPPGAIARLGTVRMRHAGATYSVGFSPDGRTLVTGGADNRVRFWEVATGKQLREFDLALKGRGSCPVYAVAYSPDGQTVAASGWGTG